MRYCVMAAVSGTPQSESTVGLNQGFLTGENESKLLGSEIDEPRPSLKEVVSESPSHRKNEVPDSQSDIDSKMMRFIKKVQNSLEEEKEHDRDKEPDLTQQLSEYLNIDLNKLSLS